ncbi:hypothetical protein [Streptomyces sp. NPDC006368]|uniref:hypothetical protein n=1 Tax=Streptomyces sp. NPDC006368 TaxID=3156760 RepID=UPI0033B1A197
MEQRSDKPKRLDLNAAQVAGSAVAAVVAAKLASNMGVYGTVLGAGVISVIATCGGSVFQHVFRTTGERVRDVTVPARVPRPRTRHARVARGEFGEPGGPADFGAPTTYGTRVRGRRRSAVGAALVFVLAMAGITSYELISGHDFGGGEGTTISSVVRGGDEAHRPATTPPPASEDGGDPKGDQERSPEEQPEPGTGSPTPPPSTTNPSPSGPSVSPPAPTPSAPAPPPSSAPESPAPEAPTPTVPAPEATAG